MSRFIRTFGWVLNAALLALAVGGVATRVGWWDATAFHLRAGLVVMLLVLFQHSLPYFHLTGSVGRFRDAVGADPMARERLDLAVRLKGSLFWPTIVVILFAIAGPVVAFVQMVGGLPAWSHGAFMAVVTAVHVRTWAKEIFALDLLGELFESVKGDAPDTPPTVENAS